jgi:hypothetical protein
MSWWRKKHGLTGGGGGGGNSLNTAATPGDVYANYTQPIVKHCTHKGTKVFMLGKGASGVVVYAVQGSRIRDLAPVGLNLWVHLAGKGFGGGSDAFVVGYSGEDTLVHGLIKQLKAYDIPPCLCLDWPDRSIPPLPPTELWHGIVNMLLGLGGQAKAKAEPYKVAFSCIGSHGRTGTALACILAVCGMSSEDAIKTVRTIHCHEAIEGKLQEDYIAYVDTKVPKILAPITLFAPVTPDDTVVPADKPKGKGK